jgi:hypothetical protein
VPLRRYAVHMTGKKQFVSFEHFVKLITDPNSECVAPRGEREREREVHLGLGAGSRTFIGARRPTFVAFGKGCTRSTSSAA